MERQCVERPQDRLYACLWAAVASYLRVGDRPALARTCSLTNSACKLYSSWVPNLVLRGVGGEGTSLLFERCVREIEAGDRPTGNAGHPDAIVFFSVDAKAALQNVPFRRVSLFALFATELYEVLDMLCHSSVNSLVYLDLRCMSTNTDCARVARSLSQFQMLRQLHAGIGVGLTAEDVCILPTGLTHLFSFVSREDVRFPPTRFSSLTSLRLARYNWDISLLAQLPHLTDLLVMRLRIGAHMWTALSSCRLLTSLQLVYNGHSFDSTDMGVDSSIDKMARLWPALTRLDIHALASVSEALPLQTSGLRKLKNLTSLHLESWCYAEDPAETLCAMAPQLVTLGTDGLTMGDWRMFPLAPRLRSLFLDCIPDMEEDQWVLQTALTQRMPRLEMLCIRPLRTLQTLSLDLLECTSLRHVLAPHSRSVVLQLNPRVQIW